MVWLFKGGGGQQLFLASWIFMKKNEATAKNFLKSFLDLSLYVLPQKFILWVKRIMHHVTSVGAVVDPSLKYAVSFQQKRGHKSSKNQKNQKFDG